jgi:hypothetical protein
VYSQDKEADGGPCKAELESVDRKKKYLFGMQSTYVRSEFVSGMLSFSFQRKSEISFSFRLKIRKTLYEYRPTFLWLNIGRHVLTLGKHLLSPSSRQFGARPLRRASALGEIMLSAAAPPLPVGKADRLKVFTLNRKD